MEQKFKVGDKVRCKIGYNTEEYSGGYGYRSGETFIIDHFTQRGNSIAWPLKGSMPSNKNECGIYIRAIEYCIPETYKIY